MRATYAFSPHLTLQLYTQLFGAGVAYGDPLRADVPPGKGTVRFSALTPALGNEPTADKLDKRQAGNVIADVFLVSVIREGCEVDLASNRSNQGIADAHLIISRDVG